jgi:hypothetical protein
MHSVILVSVGVSIGFSAGIICTGLFFNTVKAHVSSELEKAAHFVINRVDSILYKHIDSKNLPQPK